MDLVVGNWACWAKVISMVAQMWEAKGLVSMLLHYFSAAGIPTSADECLEAVQSNLTGPVLCSFSDRYVGGYQRTMLPRGQYNSLSNHFFAETGCNLTL